MWYESSWMRHTFASCQREGGGTRVSLVRDGKSERQKRDVPVLGLVLVGEPGVEGRSLESVGLGFVGHGGDAKRCVAMRCGGGHDGDGKRCALRVRVRVGPLVRSPLRAVDWAWRATSDAH